MKLKYIASLSTLCLIVTLDYVLEKNIGESQTNYNSLIHKTVDQSMRAQMANLTAYELVMAPESDKAALQKQLFHQLNGIVAQQKSLSLNNFSSLFGFVVSDKIRDKYRYSKKGEASLHKRITAYLDHMMQLTKTHNYSTLTPQNPDFVNAMQMKNVIVDTNHEMMEFFEALDAEALVILEWTSIVLLTLFWIGCIGIIAFLVYPDARRFLGMEEKIAELKFKMRGYRQGAEESEKERIQVLNDLLLAMQTPLHAINDMVENIPNGGNLKSLLDHMGIMKQLVQIDAKKSIVHIAPLDCKGFFDKLHAILIDVAATKSIQVQMDVAQLQGNIHTDYNFLHQIVLSCSYLALEAARKGPLQIKAFTNHRDSTFYDIEIMSFGEGLTQPQIETIFDPYAFQLRERDYTSPSGLALTQRLCHLLMGHISIKSLPGTDLVISLSFPKRPDPQKIYQKA